MNVSNSQFWCKKPEESPREFSGPYSQFNGQGMAILEPGVIVAEDVSGLLEKAEAGIAGLGFISQSSRSTQRVGVWISQDQCIAGYLERSAVI